MDSIGVLIRSLARFYIIPTLNTYTCIIRRIESFHSIKEFFLAAGSILKRKRKSFSLFFLLFGRVHILYICAEAFRTGPSFTPAERCQIMGAAAYERLKRKEEKKNSSKVCVVYYIRKEKERERVCHFDNDTPSFFPSVTFYISIISRLVIVPFKNFSCV